MFSPFRDLAGNAVWKNILVDICAAVVEISVCGSWLLFEESWLKSLLQLRNSVVSFLHFYAIVTGSGEILVRGNKVVDLELGFL